MTPAGDVTVISGNRQFKTARGRSSSSSHAQPTGLATEGHTIYVCDTGSQTVRIITPASPLATYLENIQKMFEVFSVHSDQTKCGYDQDVDLAEVISSMNRAQEYFKNLVDRIREHVEKPNLHPEGPHGVPAYLTVEAVTWVSDTLDSLKELFSNLRWGHKQAFRSLSILTLVVEHFFGACVNNMPCHTYYIMPNCWCPPYRRRLRS